VLPLRAIVDLFIVLPSHAILHTKPSGVIQAGNMALQRLNGAFVVQQHTKLYTAPLPAPLSTMACSSAAGL